MVNFGFTIQDTNESALGLGSSSPHSVNAMVAQALDSAAGGNVERRAEMALIERELEATVYHAIRVIARDSEGFRATVTFHGDRLTITTALS